MLSFENLLPMLLDERKVAPEDQEGYLVEPKFDGYRVLAEFGEGRCRMRSKNGADCTRWFAEVAAALVSLKCGHTIVDGEMCVLDEFGRSNFEAVHTRALRRRYTEGTPAVTYCVFDLLAVNGRDITKEPLEERKGRLATIMEAYEPEHTLYVQHMSSDDVDRPISWLYDHALQLHLEGVVAKRADSIYRPGERVREWFKLKRPGAVPKERFKHKTR